MEGVWRPRSVCRSMLLVAVMMVLVGCSNVPYFPGRWFEPSPTPGPPAPTTPIRPDIDLTGTLVTDDGITATLTTQLWWGETTHAPRLTRSRPAGWTNVHVRIHGTTTLTNTSSSPNTAATSVFYELNAGYPLRSRVCELLVLPDDASMVAGDYCWQLISTATPFSYDRGYTGPPVSLQPGQSQAVQIGASQHSAGVSVDAAEAERDVVSDELRHPAVIAVTSNDIGGLRPTFRFRRNCPGAITDLKSRNREQHVNLSSTSPLTCRQLPQLGFGY